MHLNQIACSYIYYKRLHKARRQLPETIPLYIPSYTTYIHILLANIHYVNPPVSEVAYCPSIFLQFCEPPVPRVVNPMLHPRKVHPLPSFLRKFQRAPRKEGLGQPVYTHELISTCTLHLGIKVHVAVLTTGIAQQTACLPPSAAQTAWKMGPFRTSTLAICS